MDDLKNNYPELLNYVVSEDDSRDFYVSEKFLEETKYTKETENYSINYKKVFRFIQENEHLHTIWLL